jgi:hypothetical protein
LRKPRTTLFQCGGVWSWSCMNLHCRSHTTEYTLYIQPEESFRLTLYFNVYEALISTIAVPVYVAAWLLNMFKGFSLWDLLCLFPSIKLDECGHVECSVMCPVIQTYPQIGLHSVGTRGRFWIL